MEESKLDDESEPVMIEVDMNDPGDDIEGLISDAQLIIHLAWHLAEKKGMTEIGERLGNLHCDLDDIIGELGDIK